MYSDGSGLGGHAGAAAVMYKVGQSLRVLKLHLGLLEEHTTYEVEAAGLFLALHLLSAERDACSATIMLDNQSVIQLLKYHKSGTTQYLVSGLLSQFNSIFHRLRQPDFELDIAWVKGHMDIEGNATVDKVAKEATGGNSSKVTSLPTLLAINLFWSVYQRKSRTMGPHSVSIGARIGNGPHIMPESPKSTPQCPQTTFGRS